MDFNIFAFLCFILFIFLDVTIVFAAVKYNFLMQDEENFFLICSKAVWRGVTGEMSKYAYRNKETKEFQNR